MSNTVKPKPDWFSEVFEVKGNKEKLETNPEPESNNDERINNNGGKK